MQKIARSDKIKVGAFIICSITLFSSLFFSNQILNQNQIQEEENLVAIWSLYAVTDEIESPFDIWVSKPAFSNKTKFPVYILIHGDILGPESLNVLTHELIRQEYMVVSIGIQEFSVYPTLIQLNVALNFILERDDVNTDQIGIFGHSRGSIFAILFGIMRADYIKSVVSGNFANWDLYYQYANFMASKTKDFNYILDFSIPHNILFLLNSKDRKLEPTPTRFLDEMLKENYTDATKFYGNFSEGTARQFLYSNSSFGHLSSLYDEEQIKILINWTNSALNYDSGLSVGEIDVLSIKNYVSINFFFFVFDIILVFIISFLLIKSIIFQNKKVLPLLSKLKNSIVPRPELENEGIMSERDKEDTLRYLDRIPFEVKYEEHSQIIKSFNQKDFKKKILIFLGVIYLAFIIIKIPIIPIPQSFLVSSIVPLFRIRLFSRYIYYILDLFFPFTYIWFWLLIFALLTWSFLRKEKLTRIGKYSGNNYVLGLFNGLEIFLILASLNLLILDRFFGVSFSEFFLRNGLSTYLLLYLINLFVFEFFSRIIKEDSLKYWKMVGIQFIVYFPIIFPEILNPSPILEMYFCIILLIFLNPWLYKLFKNIKVISLCNYLLMVFFFSLFYFENRASWEGKLFY
ncbi:alpha/beta hydrolase family protein [Promethearchaeum syntrophicum]|uniref:Alpha/beta hydrolase family protein n=1 Tax=Promethearchaeum syntrophicum TaxID=2594042 RepID=A0A5B9DEG7_9ARCH|nr:hypothetical protein [Candidatus Prometheoarchaeum syntrophicum]QEE17638.1 hypothetical protein DSAG12_03475 [Candidatus Prometheoarchaeum syntrophicum]